MRDENKGEHERAVSCSRAEHLILFTPLIVCRFQTVERRLSSLRLQETASVCATFAAELQTQPLIDDPGSSLHSHVLTH